MKHEKAKIAFCYKPNVWPPEKFECVTRKERPYADDRDSYQVLEYTFGDFVGEGKHFLWVNAHTGSRDFSTGRTRDNGEDIDFERYSDIRLGPFIYMGQGRFVCENWILVTDQAAFDGLMLLAKREKFLQGDDSGLMQGRLF